MSRLRVRGLESLDPLTVPLPHGTEVASRVEGRAGERRVASGAVGRVVATRGDEIDVRVVGVGVVTYRREELLPRRAGQLRFALDRAAAWESLRPCAVLEATVGSRAWGLAGEGSDVDLRGIFVLPFPWTCGLGTPPLDLVSLDGSATYWEAGKALRQALVADPNTLELLFVPSVRSLDPLGEQILAEREAFVSAEIYGSFGRYALSQLHRLGRSLHLAEHRTAVLAWLREEPAPGLDEVACRLAAASGGAGPAPGADALRQAREYLKQLCRSLHDQGLLAANDFAALVELARREPSDLELPREQRPKNAYNLLRLLSTAIGWLRTGSPEFAVRGAWRDRLLEVKRGEVSVDEVVAEAERLAPALEEARLRTKLPRHGDAGRADRLLRRIREEVARRWAAGVAGPFGREAPPAPELAWDDPEPKEP